MAYGNTPLGADLIPLGTANVPGTVDPVPIQGSTNTTTDGNGNKTTPVNMNLKQIGDVLFTLGQALKAASIPVTLASDQGTIPVLDTNSASNNTHLAAIDTATSDLVADLDTLIANTVGLATQATLASLLARHNDTFGTSTAISAATTFGAIPLISALAPNSYATLPNNGYQDTFLAQINVASAFVGTIGFYGLLPDGTTLQQINAHQRGAATNGNSTAINTGSALEQTWEGSIAAFKAIYVVCTAFTSGAASVQLGLTAANYAHAIINTVAQNLTQVGGTAPQLDGPSSNRLGMSLYGKSSAAGDTPLFLDSAGRTIIAGNVAAGATDSGNPIKVGGKYNSTLPILTDGQRGDVQLDANGNLKTREQYAPSYEDNTNGKAVVEHRYTCTRMTADTLVKSGSGLIHTVTISPITATPTAGLLTIYDNTAESGNVIYSEWIFATTPGHTLTFDDTVGTGIYVGYDGTLANVQVTVSWR